MPDIPTGTGIQGLDPDGLHFIPQKSSDGVDPLLMSSVPEAPVGPDPEAPPSNKVPAGSGLPSLTFVHPTDSPENGGNVRRLSWATSPGVFEQLCLGGKRCDVFTYEVWFARCALAGVGSGNYQLLGDRTF